jgi:hypothetical protein
VKEEHKGEHGAPPHEEGPARPKNRRLSSQQATDLRTAPTPDTNGEERKRSVYPISGILREDKKSEADIERSDD